MNSFRQSRLLLAVLILAGNLIACSQATPSSEIEPTPDIANLSGTILVDGSSTVGPITQRVAEAFSEESPNVNVDVQISGTGGGFKRFCVGETDISDASRPIKASEIEVCNDNGIEYIEIPVAFDGIAVLTNIENEFLNCLTVPELLAVWEPNAANTITNWQQIRSGFPEQDLNLYGPGTDSGTYDYFTEAIVGTEGESRMDFFGSEDDYELVDGIAEDVGGLGFFGLSYYDENRDRLRLVAIDNGQGCVEPNTETVARGLYQPLSRPLFIYINRTHINDNQTISAFVDFYLSNAPELVDDVGYIPLTDTLYELAQQRYETQTTGSVFEGSGATVGVSLADLLLKER